MSRIGKMPITVPAGIEITVDKANVVKIKGPKGELTQQIDPDISVEMKDGEVQVSRPTDQKRHKAMHGLYRSLVANMVVGVHEGYTVNLELEGVGYRASNQGQLLELQLGYSHPIMFFVPGDVIVETKMDKSQRPEVILTSCDKQLVGQIAAKIRSFRKPEPYKGKGIRFKGEILRRKAGKTGAK